MTRMAGKSPRRSAKSLSSLLYQTVDGLLGLSHSMIARFPVSLPRGPGRNAQDLYEFVSEVTKRDFGYVQLVEAAHLD